MASQPVAPLTTYGATRTTAFTTTVTATSNQERFSILFPNPPITELVQYTTFPPPLDPASKFNPSPLPILVVTDVVAIILNTNGVPISTGTLVQTPPAQPTYSGADPLTSSCSSWNCWTPGQRTGTAVAILIFIIATMGLLCWRFCCTPRDRGKRYRRSQDLEYGRDGSPQSGDSVRRRSRSRSTTSSFNSSSISVSSRLPQIQPHAPVRSNSSRLPHTQPYPPRSSSLPVGYPQPQRIVQGQRPRMRYDPQPSPPSGTSIRDFAIPAAVGLAAAGLSAASRGRRASTTSSRRLSIHDRSASKGSQGEVIARTAAWNRSQRRSNEHVEDRPRRRDFNRGRLRARSLSPPRRSRSKSKSKHFSTGMSAKWWAIIPLTLELMYKFSEPKGGWEQYHATNHNLEQRIKDFGREIFESRSRSGSPGRRRYSESPQRSRSVDSAYAKLQPPRPKSAAKEGRRTRYMNQIPQRSTQGQTPRIQNREGPSAGTMFERGGELPNKITIPEVGNEGLYSLRSSRQTQRRRVTRREARRKRDSVGHDGTTDIDSEASAAEGQRQRMGGRDGHLRGHSAPGRESSIPAPRANRVPAFKSMATAPPSFVPKFQEASVPVIQQQAQRTI